MRIMTKRLRLESRNFHYKVTLYLSCLHVEFDDEIKSESRQILSIISDYPASKVKLTSIVCVPDHPEWISPKNIHWMLSHQDVTASVMNCVHACINLNWPVTCMCVCVCICSRLGLMATH